MTSRRPAEAVEEAGFGSPFSFASPAAPSRPLAWRGGQAELRDRLLPEEVPVALTYDRATFAVMMASPADLEDLAIGFSLSEGIVRRADELMSLDVLAHDGGIECRMSLAPGRRTALEARRRHIAGPAGCGLCGMDSLAEAIRPPPAVAAPVTVAAAEIASRLAAMPALQALGRETRGVHAAAWFRSGSETLLLREDVGRHNALDKLHGALIRAGQAPAEGVLLLTSRVSIELVQKAAAMGVGILVAISVPSARAVRDAEAAGITLAAIARADGFEVFTHAGRILGV